MLLSSSLLSLLNFAISILFLFFLSDLLSFFLSCCRVSLSPFSFNLIFVYCSIDIHIYLHCANCTTHLPLSRTLTIYIYIYILSSLRYFSSVAALCPSLTTEIYRKLASLSGSIEGISLHASRSWRATQAR